MARTIEIEDMTTVGTLAEKTDAASNKTYWRADEERRYGHG